MCCMWFKMHKSTGRDAVRRGTKPVQWIPRPAQDKVVSFKMEPEFYKEVKLYCDENQIKFSQLMRYLLAKELRGT